jgi:hypothetical protein
VIKIRKCTNLLERIVPERDRHGFGDGDDNGWWLRINNRPGVIERALNIEWVARMNED